MRTGRAPTVQRRIASGRLDCSASDAFDLCHLRVVPLRIVPKPVQILVESRHWRVRPPAFLDTAANGGHRFLQMIGASHCDLLNYNHASGAIFAPKRTV